MQTYRLYLESGPKRRKTMVHVPALPGCIANGPTTEDALEASPAAIRTFLGFLCRHGEDIDPGAPFETEVAQHVTEGDWLGNGSPYVTFDSDLEPVTAQDIDQCLRQFRWMREDLAAWASTQDAQMLAAEPALRGRPAAAILRHVIGGSGAYLSPVVGGVKGFSALAGAVERGQVSATEALLREVAMAEEVARATTPEQRVAVTRRASGELRTLRKALRRTVEHDWEHLVELSRRPGGPALATDGD